MSNTSPRHWQKLKNVMRTQCLYSITVWVALVEMSSNSRKQRKIYIMVPGLPSGDLRRYFIPRPPLNIIGQTFLSWTHITFNYWHFILCTPPSNEKRLNFTHISYCMRGFFKSNELPVMSPIYCLPCIFCPRFGPGLVLKRADQVSPKQPVSTFGHLDPFTGLTT